MFNSKVTQHFIILKQFVITFFWIWFEMKFYLILCLIVQITYLGQITYSQNVGFNAVDQSDWRILKAITYGQRSNELTDFLHGDSVSWKKKLDNIVGCSGVLLQSS